MKQPDLIREFFKIGTMSAGGGPLVLAVVYACLYAAGVAETIAVPDLAVEIVTSMVLAFISGGISVIYRIETLPLMWASLLHASILYLDYLIIYLVNGWIKRELLPMLVFTGCFLIGYFIIWCFISLAIQRNIRKMNEMLTNS